MTRNIFGTAHQQHSIIILSTAFLLGLLLLLASLQFKLFLLLPDILHCIVALSLTSNLPELLNTFFGHGSECLSDSLTRLATTRYAGDVRMCKAEDGNVLLGDFCIF